MIENNVVYFELNNWFPGRDYPADEPFIAWLGNDLDIKFNDENWVQQNELCVVRSTIDMSLNFCITAKREWVEKNCPKLLTEYKEFLCFPNEDFSVIGKFGTHFLEYTEDNIGINDENF